MRARTRSPEPLSGQGKNHDFFRCWLSPILWGGALFRFPLGAQTMSASVASAGLVAFTNKGETESPSAVLKLDGVMRRLSRMRDGVISAARIVHNSIHDDAEISESSPDRSSLVTLTYRPGVKWAPDQIKLLLQHYRKWFKARAIPFRYVWTMEMQQRGAPHYHIVMWIANGHTPPFPDTQGWWPHGNSNSQFAHHPVGYIAKYASKGPGSELPKGARIWGCGGLSPSERNELRVMLAPKWLRKVVSVAAQLRRSTVEVPRVVRYASGAFRTVLEKCQSFYDRLTGLHFLSPWVSDGFSAHSGLALRHRGYIEVVSSDGDLFRINQPYKG